MMRVAAYTAGRTAPHARFRVRQYIPALRDLGFQVTEFPAALGSHPPASRAIRPLWAAATLALRLPQVLKSSRYDLTLLQREILARHETLEPLTAHPRVLDVDDAIFVGHGAGVAERLARRCDSIICGNEYLAAHFRQWNEQVAVVPTAVDTARFVPAEDGPASSASRIGWIGTSGNFKYLYAIEGAIREVLELRHGAVFRVIADRAPRFTRLPPRRVEVVHWSAENEVREIQSMTVGIMPLANGAWECGKCSFKMLQYMACGVPVVVSPVGMNVEVMAHGPAGLAATTHDEWAAALLMLLDDPVRRTVMGHTGRGIAERYFSIEAVAPRLAESLTLPFNATSAKTRRSSRSDAVAP